MDEDERAARVRELRELLEAQAARDAELLAELRALTGHPGHEQINSQIRAAAGRGTPPRGSSGGSINEQIRRAAGRPPASEEEDR